MSLVTWLVTGLMAGTANADEAAWRALERGRAIVLLRHAVTEAGIGDPPGFTIGKCETQRNLSEQGRRDALRIGEAFKVRKIPISDVLSSRWCRCVDTATLAFGRATPAPMLDSMFNEESKARVRKVNLVRDAIMQRQRAGKTSGNLILVTHQQNILAIADVSPASGEMIVTEADGKGTLHVIGRIGPDEY
ncbi:histidine phosphatase family protein [Noviherbaspirillum sp. Root189]|uniref:histidine phosphatase family protein n=1 Tax=Noviherbaspirillum sp. Root189 TaxID=1736487 RepID=UPI000AB614E7|nr:histidine phosphatase family protein [Noviherbaspirillum sp. Root189]